MFRCKIAVNLSNGIPPLIGHGNKCCLVRHGDHPHLGDQWNRYIFHKIETK